MKRKQQIIQDIDKTLNNKMEKQIKSEHRAAMLVHWYWDLLCAVEFSKKWPRQPTCFFFKAQQTKVASPQGASGSYRRLASKVTKHHQVGLELEAKPWWEQLVLNLFWSVTCPLFPHKAFSHSPPSCTHPLHFLCEGGPAPGPPPAACSPLPRANTPAVQNQWITVTLFTHAVTFQLLFQIRL